MKQVKEDSSGFEADVAVVNGFLNEAAATMRIPKDDDGEGTFFWQVRMCGFFLFSLLFFEELLGAFTKCSISRGWDIAYRTNRDQLRYALWYIVFLLV